MSDFPSPVVQARTRGCHAIGASLLEERPSQAVSYLKRVGRRLLVGTVTSFFSFKMAAKAAEKTEFIDNTARRKWDKEECASPMPNPARVHISCRYERRAKERAERDEAAVVEVLLMIRFFPLLC